MINLISSDSGKNFFLLFLSSNFKFLINFGTQILLARLLFPEIFGQFAIILGILEITFLIFFVSSAAVLRFQNLDNIFFTSWVLNFLNIIIIIILNLIIFFWLIEEYLGSTPLKLTFFLILISKSLKHFYEIHEAWMEKNFNLRATNKYNLYTSIISNLTVASLALSGLGIVSLAVKEFVDSFLYFVFIKKSSNLKFKSKNFNRDTAKKIIFFSFKNILTRSVEILNHRLSVFFSYTFFSLNIAGLYDRTLYLANINKNLSSSILDRISFAIYAKYQKSFIKNDYFFTINNLIKNTFILPISIFIFFYASEIVVFIFGEKWEKTGLFLSCLAPWIYFTDTNKSIYQYLIIRSSNIYQFISVTIYIIGLICGGIFSYYLENIIYLPIIESLFSFIVFCYLLIILKRKDIKFTIFTNLLKAIFILLFLSFCYFYLKINFILALTIFIFPYYFYLRYLFRKIKFKNLLRSIDTKLN